MEINIKQITCCNCGVIFWITESHNSDLLRTKTTFYCPNGHGQSYQGETDKQKYEKELQEKQRIKSELLSQLSNERQNVEKLRKSIIGYKGMLGRYKKQQVKKVKSEDLRTKK